MKKIPTELKQLAERRARLAGELKTCDQVIGPIYEEIVFLKRRLETAEVFFAAGTAKQKRLRQELAEIDKGITDVSPSVNPGAIAPIKAWKGNYGKRGSLRNFLCDTIKRRSPCYIPTNELAKLVILEFALVFDNAKARKDWRRHSVLGTLAALVRDGFIEKGEFRNPHATGTWKTWGWKQESKITLADLVRLSSPILVGDHSQMKSATYP